MTDGRVNLEDYLTTAPRLPDGGLQMAGFMNQQFSVERESGHQVNIVVTTHPVVIAAHPPDNDRLPIILDICVGAVADGRPENWAWILDKILSLRRLKNRMCAKTLT